jgi:hypothetical protein
MALIEFDANRKIHSVVRPISDDGIAAENDIS